MSGSTPTVTVAATPSTAQFAQDLLAMIAALSGAATDYNQGSQIRTFAESAGSVVATEGVGAQALVYQAIVYSALSLFGIPPTGASAATGVVTFATSFPSGSAPGATQAVAIPSGTLVQTSGGIIFSTTALTTLVSGATGISVGAQALQTGIAGNVPALAINGFPITSLGYPLSVQNQAPMAGGLASTTPSQAFALFTSEVDALGLCSPVAIANAVIGLNYGAEVVRYGACYEGWLAAGSGAGSGTAGFTVYIDNGTGTASANLLATVTAFLTGSVTASGAIGHRPAGVPFAVSGVTPVYANVVVSGSTIPGVVQPSTVINTATSGIQTYFSSLGFDVPAELTQISAVASNAALGFYESLAVTLYYTVSGSTPVTSVSGTSFGSVSGANTRIYLNSLTVSIVAGT